MRSHNQVRHQPGAKGSIQIRNLASSAHYKMIYMPGKRTTRRCESDETSRKPRWGTSPMIASNPVSGQFPDCRQTGSQVGLEVGVGKGFDGTQFVSGLHKATSTNGASVVGVARFR